MTNTIHELKKYLREVLDVTIEPKPWPGVDRLPVFLRDTYRFYEAKLLGAPCIIMESYDAQTPGPAAVRDHMNRVFAQSSEICVFVQQNLSSYNRKRLIEQRVPFVVPGNQMYLPDLGIDLREHFRHARAERKHLSPAAQTVVLYALVFGANTPMSPSGLAEKLGYTRMTMTRALDELKAMELGDVNRQGRERWLRFPNEKHELWEKAQPFMQSPVIKRLWVKKHKRLEPLVVAGLSALARYSMLNPPRIPAYALTLDAWKTLRQRGVSEIPVSEDFAYEVEIWRYQPALFAKDHLADRFSLYLRLRDNPDERVEQALDAMMEQIQW